MKRMIRSETTVKTYRNKRNPNKRLEVHEDGYGHRTVKQYMHWDENDVTNPTGDGNLHRWRKDSLDELLEDYEPVESASDEGDDDLWKPFSQGTYCVSSDAEIRLFYTDDPKAAIREWFRLEEKDPMNVAISCQTAAQAVKLCKVATPELLTKLAEKYPRCPYKLDWLIYEAQKKVADGQKYFYEDKYGYGDTIHPFGVG